MRNNRIEFMFAFVYILSLQAYEIARTSNVVIYVEVALQT